MVVATNDPIIHLAALIELRGGGHAIFKKRIRPASEEAFRATQHQPDVAVGNQRDICVGSAPGRTANHDARCKERCSAKNQKNAGCDEGFSQHGTLIVTQAARNGTVSLVTNN